MDIESRPVAEKGFEDEPFNLIVCYADEYGMIDKNPFYTFKDKIKAKVEALEK